MTDCFIAFWSGMAGGAVIGIMASAVLTAIANKIEGDSGNERESEHKENGCE